MAKTLAEYVQEATRRDQEFRNRCNTCAKPLVSGEPLGPYLVTKEVPPDENLAKETVPDQKP